MSTAPKLDGIHHLKLPVTDLDRSLAWYQEHLGYGVMTSSSKTASGWAWR